MTKIAASIRPRSYEHGEDLILSAQIAGADMIELWCDKLNPEDAKKLVIISELPVIANLKDKSENGEFKGTMYEKITFLEELIQNGAVLIDLPFCEELKQVDIERLTKNLILSYHDFEATPSLDEIENIINSMEQLNPKYIKLAFSVQREIDLMNLFKLQTNRRDLWGKSIILGMGQRGMVTRMTSSMFSHPFTFACIDKYSKTAPGQMTITQLRKIWKRFGFQDNPKPIITRKPPNIIEDSL
jgi:3-dehydroquinate dehydratase type I